VLRIDAAGPVIACGVGALRLTELQRPGGKRQAARQLLQALALAGGAVL
jgi:methionyl-tRNA formyltransferase